MAGFVINETEPERLVLENEPGTVGREAIRVL